MNKNFSKRKIKGGVKLFKESENFLSCEEVKDASTKLHNIASKKIKENKKHKIIDNIEEPDETGENFYIFVCLLKFSISFMTL